MKLTNQQIRSLTVGAIHTEETAEGLRFYKCTAKQIAAWYAQSETLGERAETTTGIRLDFYTNSRSLTLRVGGGNKFEIYTNNLLQGQYLFDSIPEKEVTVALTDSLGAPQDETRVTLHLPSHSAGVIREIELDDGSYVRPHAFDRKLLFIGDSITQGWAASFDTFSFAYRVSRHYNAESVIQGIGGAYYHEATFDHLPFAPDAVLVAYGTNDFGHYKTLDELRSHVSAHLDLLVKEYAGKPFFVLSPIWRGKRDGKAMGSFEECRQVIIEEAQKRNLVHIDGLKMVPPLPIFFQDEYLHPNDNGFALYADNLIVELEKHLPV
ncbi:MAG: SGNH/GDSL hydrolase family protein [Clostridia bacterium]|nr:SGNH/GDSL hydrolase family protein [Clostridia bacterium]